MAVSRPASLHSHIHCSRGLSLPNVFIYPASLCPSTFATRLISVVLAHHHRSATSCCFYLLDLLRRCNSLAVVLFPLTKAEITSRVLHNMKFG